jgi:putative ABC transport system permease protein
MLGFDVIEGRVFSESDTPTSDPVAVVNRSFHTRFMAGRYEVGETLTRCHEPGACLPPLRVVGVVDDVLFDGADTEVGAEVYQVARQAPDYGGEHIIARVIGDAASLESVIVEGIHDVDHELAVSDYASLDGLRRNRDRPRRFLAGLLGALAAVAAGLAVTGIFGVAALSAASRTRELGLRRALGSSARGLVALVLMEGIGVAALGIGVGLVLAWAFALAFARFFETVLWGVAPHDPLTWLSSGALFAAVAVAATWLPARRVGRVDVMRVLNEL